MWRSILAFLSASTCCLLIGCATEQQRQATKMERNLAAYVGRSVADVALDHGPPTETIDMGSDKRGFQWRKTAQTAGVAVPVGGSLVTLPPEQQTCTVSFVATTSK